MESRGKLKDFRIAGLNGVGRGGPHRDWEEEAGLPESTVCPVEGAVGWLGISSVNSGQVCFLIQPLGEHEGGWGKE